MTDTPRTDDRVLYAEEIGANTRSEWVNAPFARGLERELNAANERIKRLEDVLDALTLVVGLTPILGNKDALQEAMDLARGELKAKEAKP